MYLNQPVTSLLLDTYPNAAAAYSVRKLRTAYAGSALRVRRSSDNAESDIGFDINGNLDESALTTFVGAGNGFVTTWYDQSGNGRNVTQSTAGNQPQIVASGVVIKENSRPSMRFDGSNDNLFNTTTGFAVNNITQYVVSTRDTAGVLQSVCSTGILAGSAIGFGFNYSDTNLLSQQTRDLSTAIGSGDYSNVQGNISLISSINTSSAINTYYNGGNLISTPATLSGNSNTYITLGARYNTLNVSALFLNGKISEYVFWQNNLSANINAINNNINSYYTIY